jgi:hypothetical protein
LPHHKALESTSPEMKKQEQGRRLAAWPFASCSVREKYQVAPFELPLISFPWAKKEEVIENNSRASEKRRIV